MKVVEFGRKDAPVAVLLHGGGLSLGTQAA